jgi:transcriptional regulator with XRE-family HTH domain
MHANTPHEVDVFVGERIRVIRTSLGMSQFTLAERVHVSFQQLHKYETGATRVSASRLVMIARALGVSSGTLLPGAEAPDARDELLQVITAERDTLKAKLQQVRQIVGY